jgi:endonuclease/exonuclease/phosphatase family metal-dependent hydrolase
VRFCDSVVDIAQMTELRVLSWNIHKGVGGRDRRYNLERTVSVLRHYAADVVLLQEVAQGIPRLGHHNQAELLTEALGYHFAFSAEHQFKVGGYGNLVLSRFPIAEQRHIDLTIGWRKRRGALQCHIMVPVTAETHRPLVVHNLHLGLAGSAGTPTATAIDLVTR